MVASMLARRLLAVAPVDHPGGAEIHLLRLMGGLRDRGWQTTLTTPGRGPLRATALGEGHGWKQLGVGGLAPHTGGRAVLSWPRARRLARDADVMYLNGTVCGRLLPGLVGVRARRVLHVHDMVGRVPPHWKRADVVLADSNAVAAPLAPLDPHVVYGPVEPDPPDVAPPWDTSAPGPVIGFVGRIEPRKGPLDLARAAPAIRNGAPDARIVIVGSDPYASDPDYEREVRSAPGVEHHDGWVEGAAGLLRHLDVLVLPSYQEPFGTILAEAMAVGTPVVATRVDGLPEVVDDGATGALVEPGNPDDVARGVLEVLAHRDELGRAARRSATRFHVDAYVDRVERLISAPSREVRAHGTRRAPSGGVAG
jgi:glycosyltransferase involved in cell wall biosynthesis